jgi:hypothetical protein
LEHGEYAPSAEGGAKGRPDTKYAKWKAHCDSVIHEAFLAWVVREAQAHALDMDVRPWRLLLPTSMEEARAMAADPLPRFLDVCGDYGRAALRMLGPQLGQWTTGRAPDCQWCRHPGGEQGWHLLSCPGRPQHLREPLQAALSAIQQEIYVATSELIREDHRLLASMYKLSWKGQRDSTLADCLFYMGRLIDSYSALARRSDPRVAWGRLNIPPVRLAFTAGFHYSPPAVEASSALFSPLPRLPLLGLLTERGRWPLCPLSWAQAIKKYSVHSSSFLGALARVARTPE